MLKSALTNYETKEKLGKIKLSSINEFQLAATKQWWSYPPMYRTEMYVQQWYGSWCYLVHWICPDYTCFTKKSQFLVVINIGNTLSILVKLWHQILKNLSQGQNQKSIDAVGKRGVLPKNGGLNFDFESTSPKDWKCWQWSEMSTLY